MPLPDIESALRSFQGALDAGEISVDPGLLDASIHLHVDQPEGNLRLTFVKLDGRRN
jgi:hypothetical protein